MSISTTFKRVGSRIKESFISKPRQCDAVVKVNKMVDRINELQSSDLPKSTLEGTFQKNITLVKRKIVELENDPSITMDNVIEKTLNRYGYKTPNVNSNITVQDVISNVQSKEQAMNIIQSPHNIISNEEKTEAINVINNSDLPDKVSIQKEQTKKTFIFKTSPYSNKENALYDLRKQLFTQTITWDEFEQGKTQIDNSNLPSRNSIATDMVEVKQDDTPKFSSVQPHYFVKYGYYLLYDGGVCYLQTDLNYNIPVELIKLTESLPSPCSISMINDTQGTSRTNQNCFSKYRHMTQTEYNDLVKQNLPIDDILKVYQRRQSPTTGFGGGLGDNRLKKVLLNITNSIPVF